MQQKAEPPAKGNLGLQARVVDKLRQMIIDGELRPGTTLSEVGLGELFNVSRTPVREALKQLQAEGLVEVRPRVGTFVSTPSRRAIIELCQVKEVLEGLAARLLAMRGDVPEVERLKQNVAASETAISKGMVESYAELVHEFHQLILDGADNDKLSWAYRGLMNQLAYHRLVRTSLSRPGRPADSVAEHKRILDAILVKDAVHAERAMRDHVASSCRELMLGLGEQQE